MTRRQTILVLAWLQILLFVPVAGGSTLVLAVLLGTTGSECLPFSDVLACDQDTLLVLWVLLAVGVAAGLVCWGVGALKQHRSDAGGPWLVAVWPAWAAMTTLVVVIASTV